MLVSMGVLSSPTAYAAGNVTIKSLPNSKIIKKNNYVDSELKTISASSPIEFSAAANERESAQIIINSTENINSITITSTDFTGNAGTIPANKLDRAFEWYVNVDKLWTSSANALTGLGWYPDALINYNMAVGEGLNILDTTNGNNQGIWLTIDVPAGTKAGEYTATLTVTCDGDAQFLPMKLTVYDFELPYQTKSATHFATQFYSSTVQEIQSTTGLKNATQYRKEITKFANDNKVGTGYPLTEDWAVSNLNKYISELYTFVTTSKVPYYNLSTHYTYTTDNVLIFSQYDHNQTISGVTYYLLGMETVLKAIADKSMQTGVDMYKYAYLYCPQTDEPGQFDLDSNLKVLLNDYVFTCTKQAVRNYINTTYSSSSMKNKLLQSLDDIIYLPTTDPTLLKTKWNRTMYVSLLYNGLQYFNLGEYKQTVADVYLDGYKDQNSVLSSYEYTVPTNYRLKNYCVQFTDLSTYPSAYARDAQGTLAIIETDSDLKMWWYGCCTSAYDPAISGYILNENANDNSGDGSSSTTNAIAIARINRWQQHKMGLRGELYWALDYFKNIDEDNNVTPNDPWINPCNFKQVADDGVLIYPNNALVHSEDKCDPANGGYGWFSSSVRFENVSAGCDDYDYLCIFDELISKLKVKGIDTSAYRKRLNTLYNTMFDDVNYDDGKATSANLKACRESLANMITEMKYTLQGNGNEVTNLVNRTWSIGRVNNWKSNSKALCFRFKPSYTYTTNEGKVCFCLQNNSVPALCEDVIIDLSLETASKGVLSERDSDGWFDYYVLFSELTSTGNDSTTATKLYFTNVGNSIFIDNIRVADNVIPSTGSPDNSYHQISINSVQNWKLGGAAISFNYKLTDTFVGVNNNVTMYLIQSDPWKTESNPVSINLAAQTATVGEITDLGNGWYNYFAPMSAFTVYTDGNAEDYVDRVVFRWMNHSFLIDDFKILKELLNININTDWNNYVDIKNWHTSGKVLSFEYRPTSTVSEGSKFRLSLVDSVSAPEWIRIADYIMIDTSAKTVKCSSQTVGTVTEKNNGNFEVSIPLNGLPVNTAEGATGEETLNLLYFAPAQVKKSVCIDNIKLTQEMLQSKNRTINNALFMPNFANSGKGFTFEYRPTSTEVTGDTIAYTIWKDSWTKRLTEIETISLNGNNPDTAIYGEIEALDEGWYRYTVKLDDRLINTLEGANGNETAELVYFNSAETSFEIRNLGEYTVLEDIDIYAQFTLNGGRLDGNRRDFSRVMRYGDLTKLPVPTKIGYDFVGYTGSNGTTPEQTITVTNNLTKQKQYTLNWQPKNITVTLDPNGGSGGTQKVYYTFDTTEYFSDAAHTHSITAIEIPTRTGYRFKGYYNENTAVAVNPRYITNDGTINASGPYCLYDRYDDSTVYAMWDANSYTVHFNANGGSGSMNDESFTYGTSKALTANLFTKTGYAFTGWDTSSSGTKVVYSDGQSVSTLTSTADATVNLYAVWTANTYTIKFDPNGGTFKNSDLITTELGTFGSSNGYSLGNISDYPTRTGYAFKGWKLTYEGNSQSNYASTTTYTSGQTQAYTGAGGSFIGITQDRVILPPASTMAGMVLYNLCANAGDTAVFTAQWQANEYTIKFNPNGGVFINSASITTESGTFGSSNGYSLGNISDYPTRTGYTFKGWKLTYEGTSQPNYATTATYTSGQTQAYTGAGGSLTGITQDRIILPPASTMAGMVLYNLCANAGDTAIFTAQWQANTYTVKFNANGGTGNMSDQSFTYGESNALNANTFERTSYTFIGWDTEIAGKTVVYTDRQTVSDLSAVNNGTVNLYAVWTQNTVEIKLKNADGTNITYIDSGTGQTSVFTGVNADVNATLDSASLKDSGGKPITPVKDGCVFTGWYTTASAATGNDTSKAISHNTAINQNTELYAGFTPIGTVTQEDSDTYIRFGNVKQDLSGFELVGVQIRTVYSQTYGGTGLRFVSRINKQLISSLESLSDKSVKYGHIVAFASAVQNGDLTVDSCVPVNGVYKAQKSEAINKLYRGNRYNVFSTVINGIAVSDYPTDFVARPYICYTDASGIERYHYYTETGSNALGKGYKANLKGVAQYILNNNTAAVAADPYLSKYIDAILNDREINEEEFSATHGPINGGNYPPNE